MYEWWEYILFGVIILGTVVGIGVVRRVAKRRRGPDAVEIRQKKDRGFRGRS